MLKTITAGLLALLAWSMTPAHAATIDYKKFTGECKDPCYFIYIDGDIERGDGQKFTDLVVSTTGNVGTVVLNSPGGAFKDGMVIAKLVHERNFATYVKSSAGCTSMCAIIWLAGDKRYYGGKAKIGFHSMSLRPLDKQGNVLKNSKGQTWNGGNALVGAFYNQLGLSDEAIMTLTDADYTSIFWLNTKNIQELGITAERFDG
jgi:hypothetical protein